LHVRTAPFFPAKAVKSYNSVRKTNNSKLIPMRFLRNTVLFFFASTILIVLIYRFIPPPATPLMLIRVVEQLGENKAPKMQRNWVSISNISENLELAVIASEDNNFTTHFGIDLKAIEKAQKLNKRGRKLRGGSTITQQTAKNIFLVPSRNWVRKGLELYFTVLIELLWGKERIMEVYLNSIEMGDGIYGAEAASREYFHKSARSLTRTEAALIAAVLPNPRRWHPNNPSGYIQLKKNRILVNMSRVEGLE
jgi:monofunctional glycosyltransferase